VLLTDTRCIYRGAADVRNDRSKPGGTVGGLALTTLLLLLLLLLLCGPGLVKLDDVAVH
jgi:hypothetical protein